jgi:hypothetical protein
MGGSQYTTAVTLMQTLHCLFFKNIDLAWPKYSNFKYYQTYGGGPEGGYITNDIKFATPQLGYPILSGGGQRHPHLPRRQLKKTKVREHRMVVVPSSLAHR